MSIHRTVAFLALIGTAAPFQAAHAGWLQTYRSNSAVRKIDKTMSKEEGIHGTYSGGSAQLVHGKSYIASRYNMQRGDFRKLTAAVDKLAKHAEDAAAGKLSEQEKANVISMLRAAKAPNQVTARQRDPLMGLLALGGMAFGAPAVAAVGLRGATENLHPDQAVVVSYERAYARLRTAALALDVPHIGIEAVNAP